MKQSCCVLLGTLLMGCLGIAQAQTEGVSKTPEKKLTLEVKETPTLALSLRGEDIFLPEITAALAQKLRLPITLSPRLQTQRVTLDIVGYSVEQTMRLLAPRSVIDSVVSGNAATPPQYLAIYLLSFEDALPEPRTNPNAPLSGAEGSFALEEESAAKTEREKRAKAIIVRTEHSLLSVRARQKTLLATLTALATELNVICELQGNADETIDVEFSGYSWPAAAQALSPRLQFFLRQHLQTNETQLWRIVLTAPTTP